MAKHTKRWIVAIIGLVLMALLFRSLFSGIQLVTIIPTVFNEQKVTYTYKDGMTFINGDSNITVIHDDEALYLLGGATDEFKKYYIDNVSGELVISRNIVSPIERSQPSFQVIKVPNDKYKDIVHNGKVKIRIKYLYLGEQFTLLEYDLATKKTNLITNAIVGK